LFSTLCKATPARFCDGGSPIDSGGRAHRFSPQAQADIYEWVLSNGTVTESTTVCPAVTAFCCASAGLPWHNLTQAYLIDADLSFANLSSSTLTNANLTNANLTMPTLTTLH